MNEKPTMKDIEEFLLSEDGFEGFLKFYEEHKDDPIDPVMAELCQMAVEYENQKGRVMNDNFIYPELNQAVGNGKPNYPKTCPICGAGIAVYYADEYNGPTYECGGQYQTKPQIQNHTDKWWGQCPATCQKKLEVTGVLEADVTVWAVYKNGIRKLVSSFIYGSLGESYARALSKDFPRAWEVNNKIAYIEALGDCSFCLGARFKDGKMIARYDKPYHIKMENYSPVWFEVNEKSLGSYEYGKIIEESC